MASNFPKLPGFVPTYPLDQNDFRRVSARQQDFNRDIKNHQKAQFSLPRIQKTIRLDNTRALNENYLTTNQDTYKAVVGEDNQELYQPSYVHMDRHTLCFYGYFEEKVTESAFEKNRIRNLIIYYYLEDMSISIVERTQNNSGIP